MKRRKLSKFTTVLLFCLLVSVVGNIHLFFRAKDYRDGANEWLDKYTNVVDEYSRLSVFQNENLLLKSDSIVNNRVVFYGTQVIARWDFENRFEDYETINRGVTGQWVSGLLLRYHQDVITLKPEYVLLEVSSYNLRQRFPTDMVISHVQTMVDLSLYHGIQPILTTMIPLRKGHDQFGNYSVMSNIKDYNDWIRDFAHKKELKILDMYNILSNDAGYLKKELSFDSIDPNEAGYSVLSDSLLSLLEE